MKFTRTGIASLAVLVIAATALVLTSIGSASPAKTKATPFKMALVTDIGSLQDRSFNQLANTGRKVVSGTLFIPTRVYETHSESERIPNMLAASKAGYNLIFAVGFLNYNALNSVAPKFPKLRYAGIDEAVRALQQEAEERDRRHLRRAATPATSSATSPGLEAKKEKFNTISAVGANNVPAIVRYISGYIQGAKKAYPGIKVLANYANDPTFNDQAKCHETALNQIDQGSHVVFQVAGGCGLGALAGGEGEQGLGHRRRCRPALPRPAHHDQRAQARRQGGRGPDQAREGGQAEDRRQLHLQPEERRRRPGLGQPEDPEGVRHEDERGREADRAGQDPASSRSSSSRHACSRFSGVGSAHPRRIAAMASGRGARPRAAGNHEGLPGHSSPTTTSISTSAAAKSTRCSARTAPARRR